MAKNVKRMRPDFDPFFGELMSIQYEEKGEEPFYVEIKDLQWSGYFKTYTAALDAGLNQLRKIQVDESLADLQAELKNLNIEREAMLAGIHRVEQKLEDVITQIVGATVNDLDDELEMLEQEDDLKRWAKMAYGGSWMPPRVQFRIWKDVDGDGDLDVCVGFMSSRRKFVKKAEDDEE